LLERSTPLPSLPLSLSLSDCPSPASLSQKHAVRANRVLGQVVIPFSWIVDRLSLKLKSPNRSKARLSGWFELFPYCKPSRLNRGGQYRPFIPGIPPSAGYGLVKPEKVTGLSLADSPFAHLVLLHSSSSSRWDISRLRWSSRFISRSSTP
jgi:hypothetical protein